MRNVAASYLLCSCRANAVQQSGNPAAAAPPSNAQVSSFPTHPTLRHSTRAPRPGRSLRLPAARPAPARLHNVCAPPAIQAHAPHGLGPSRAHRSSPSPRMPAHFSSALGCQIILDPAPLPARPRTSGPRPIPRAPFLSAAVAAGRSNASPDRRTAAHSTAGPLGRRRPGRRAQAGPFVPGRRRSACWGNSSFRSY